MNNWKLNDWGTKCSLVHIHGRKKKLKSTCPVGEYISVFTFLDFNIVIRGGMSTKHAWIFNSYFLSTRCFAILAVWKVLEQLKIFLPHRSDLFFSCFDSYSSLCICYAGNGWFGSNNWGVLGSRCRGKVDSAVCRRASRSVPLTFKLWIWTFSYRDDSSKQNQHHSVLKRVNNINTSE